MMKRQIRFTKMEGCGNDYIYISTFDQQVDYHSALAKLLSDRHFGIGGDGVIYVCPSENADAKMRMFNEDGSEGKMCGNGIRCVAKFLYDKNICKKETLRIETLSGIKEVKLCFDGETATGAEVDMGKAGLSPDTLPVLLDGDKVVNRELTVENTPYRVTCVSMGNPHCILFVDDPETLDLPAIGPKFENHALFPERTNTEFVHVIDGTHLEMRVWERGSGETLACGTGACASVVAATLNGYCKKGTPVNVRLRGGELTILYTDDGVSLTGPATTVFEGTIEI